MKFLQTGQKPGQKTGHFCLNPDKPDIYALPIPGQKIPPLGGFCPGGGVDVRAIFSYGTMESGMAFIYTDNGSVNLDHVLRIQSRWRGSDKSTRISITQLISAQGDVIGETHLDTLAIETASYPVVSADTGAFAYKVWVDLTTSPPSPVVTQKQIVAWRIPPRAEPIPVFTDGDYDEEHIVLPLPDGRFYRQDLSWHDSLDDAVRDILSEVAP